MPAERYIASPFSNKKFSGQVVGKKKIALMKMVVFDSLIQPL